VERYRWMQQADLVCYSGTHLIITILAMTGLAIWSFGLLIFLANSIMKNRSKMTNPDVQRRYAYFVSGYEVDKAYWDILVKKTDNLLTIAVTYTSVATDPKAKLLCYAVLAGAFLIIHVLYAPFDERKNGLCDRLEMLGLMARFQIFGFFELLLIFGGPPWWLGLCCFFTICSSGWFLFSIGAHTACEFLADFVSKQKEGVVVQDDVFKKLREKAKGFEKPSAMKKVVGVFGKCFKMFFRCCIKPILGIVVAFAKAASSVYKILEDDALCLMPAPNFVRRVQPRATRRTGCLQRLRFKLTLKFFRQSDSDQRDFIVTTFGAFFNKIVCQMEEERLEVGEGLLGRFIVIAGAIKEAVYEDDMPPATTAVEKCESVKRHLYSSLTRAVKHCMFDDDDKFNVDDLIGGSDDNVTKEELLEINKLRLTGEDLNDALMLLHRCEVHMIQDLLHEALSVIARVKEEMGKQSALAHAAGKLTIKDMEKKVGGAEDNEDSGFQIVQAADSADPHSSSKNAWKAKALDSLGLDFFGTDRSRNGNSTHGSDGHGDDRNDAGNGAGEEKEHTL